MTHVPLYAVLIMAAVTGLGATAANSAVQSGDILVFTNHVTSPAKLNKQLLPVGSNGEYGVAVVSPTGLQRFGLKFTYAYSKLSLDLSASVAISPDGNYAFVSAALKGKGIKMGIRVIRLKGNKPKVIKTAALPSSKFCTPETGAAIAVGPATSTGDYDLYISRACYDGPPVYQGKYDGDHPTPKPYHSLISAEVVKYRYSLSSGNLKASAKKLYSQPITKQNKFTYGYFSKLQVIDGVPYGLLLRPQVFTTDSFKLVRLGSQKALASNDLRDYTSCKSSLFTFASTNRFYGVCQLDALRGTSDYEKGIIRSAIVSVLGNKSILGPVPLNDTYAVGGGFVEGRFDWEGPPAVDPKSSNVYAIMADATNAGNMTLYKVDSSNIGDRPKALFKFGASVVSSGSVDELLVVP